MFLIKKLNPIRDGYNYYRRMLQGIPIYGKPEGAARYKNRIEAQNALYDIDKTGQEHEIVREG